MNGRQELFPDQTLSLEGENQEIEEENKFREPLFVCKDLIDVKTEIDSFNIW